VVRSQPSPPFSFASPLAEGNTLGVNLVAAVAVERRTVQL
jgi:hypothetical protein